MARRRSMGPSVSFFAFQDIITAVVGIFILITLVLALELAQRVENATSGQTTNVTQIAAAIETLKQEVARLNDLARERSIRDANESTLNAFNREELMDQMKRRLEMIKTRTEQVEGQAEDLRREQEVAEAESNRLKAEALSLQPKQALIDQLTDRIRQFQSRIDELLGDSSPLYRDEAEDGRFVVIVVLDGLTIEVRDALTQHSDSFAENDRVDRFESWLDASALKTRHIFVIVKPGGGEITAKSLSDLRREVPFMDTRSQANVTL